jgi:ABC-2 type transport system permease protein
MVYGARPMSLGLFSSESFYLYGFLEVGEGMEQLNLVGEGVTAASVRETVENALRRQTPGFLKTVGVVAPGTDLPPEVMAQLQMQGRQMPPPEFQQVREFLGRDYQVQSVDLAADNGVPTDIDVLLVIKPRDLDERSVYNLDQYLMRGGRVILCAARYEPDFSGGELKVAPVSTGLDAWLAHFGITIEDTLVLDDRNQPLPVPEVRRTLLGNIRTLVLKPYPYLVEVRDEGLANRQITARLEAVGIYWGSPLVVEPPPDASLEMVPILKSSPKSWTSQDLSQVQFADYTVPATGTESQLLAAALSGRFASYFADKGAPGSTPAGVASDPADAGAAAPPRAEVPLKLSPETRLVVVGDTAFLSDFVARVLAGAQGGFFAENLAFVQNVIDWSTLDNDLVGIRARGLAARHLQRLESSTEITIEVVNYLVPVLLLLVLGAYRMWLRRNATPVVAAPGSIPRGSASAARGAQA